MAANGVDEQAIFSVARQIPQAQAQADYLEQICGNDTALLARVQGLLRVSQEQPDFLESPPSGVDATLDAQPVSEQPGTTIGKYKLMEQIGEGGMGVVYVAEQQRPLRRKVALKVIKPGMDTKEVIARFEAERQALALMNHTNIAKVLDAGSTDSGRPYSVMELVQGIPITEYCDRCSLTTQQRLELFVTVCQAVQHAHQKGIIHRDLKPSNVMITEHDGSPVVKVNLKEAGRLFKEWAGYRYAFGRLLIGRDAVRALTGATPFDRERFHQAAYEEMVRIIREEEPPKPSTKISTLGEQAERVSAHRGTDSRKLSQLVRGDVDWIVMKAIEKDRSRRYETAAVSPPMCNGSSTTNRLKRDRRHKATVRANSYSETRDRLPLQLPCCWPLSPVSAVRRSRWPMPSSKNNKLTRTPRR